MRVVVSALAICAASFLVGVAGDLSASAFQEPPARPQIVQLPPVGLPPVDLTNAVRAHPLTARPVSHVVTPMSAPAPAALVLEPVQVEPEAEITFDSFESLVGGPDEAAASPAIDPLEVKRQAHIRSLLAGKAADEKAQKA